jgi:hypothetical protein
MSAVICAKNVASLCADRVRSDGSTIGPVKYMQNATKIKKIMRKNIIAAGFIIFFMGIPKIVIPILPFYNQTLLDAFSLSP